MRCVVVIRCLYSILALRAKESVSHIFVRMVQYWGMMAFIVALDLAIYLAVIAVVVVVEIKRDTIEKQQKLGSKENTAWEEFIKQYYLLFYQFFIYFDELLMKKSQIKWIYGSIKFLC